MDTDNRVGIFALDYLFSEFEVFFFEPCRAARQRVFVFSGQNDFYPCVFKVVLQNFHHFKVKIAFKHAGIRADNAAVGCAVSRVQHNDVTRVVFQNI